MLVGRGEEDGGGVMDRVRLLGKSVCVGMRAGILG